MSWKIHLKKMTWASPSHFTIGASFITWWALNVQVVLLMNPKRNRQMHTDPPKAESKFWLVLWLSVGWLHLRVSCSSTCVVAWVTATVLPNNAPEHGGWWWPGEGWAGWGHQGLSFPSKEVGISLVSFMETQNSKGGGGGGCSVAVSKVSGVLSLLKLPVFSVSLPWTRRPCKRWRSPLSGDRVNDLMRLLHLNF